VRRERDVPVGTRLAELRSPLDDILIPINTASVNGVADQLFLALGQAIAGEGTRAGGSDATARALDRLDVPRAGLVQVDGSGLSRLNRVTAHQITSLLRAVLARDPRTAELFLGSLAVAGERGTLEDRMSDTPAEGRVHAKTGWISGASGGKNASASGRRSSRRTPASSPPASRSGPTRIPATWSTPRARASRPRARGSGWR